MDQSIEDYLVVMNNMFTGNLEHPWLGIGESVRELTARKHMVSNLNKQDLYDLVLSGDQEFVSDAKKNL